MFEAFVMPAVGTETRERKVHLAVELEFLGDDFESGGAPRRLRVGAPTAMRVGAGGRTANHFFRDGVLYIFDAVGEVVWGFGYLIVLGVRVAPAVALFLCFFFSQREVFLGDGLVVCEGREFWREEFAVGVYSAFLVHIWHGGHVLLDLGD